MDLALNQRKIRLENMSSFIVYLYGFLILIGGIMGHWKAGSKASLITSVVSAFFLFLSAIAMQKRKRWGWMIAFITMLSLDLFFLYRTYLTMKFFPSGMMAVISAFAATCLWLLRHRFFKQLSSTQLVEEET